LGGEPVVEEAFPRENGERGGGGGGSARGLGVRVRVRVGHY